MSTSMSKLTDCLNTPFDWQHYAPGFIFLHIRMRWRAPRKVRHLLSSFSGVYPAFSYNLTAMSFVLYTCKAATCCSHSWACCSAALSSCNAIPCRRVAISTAMHAMYAYVSPEAAPMACVTSCVSNFQSAVSCHNLQTDDVTSLQAPSVPGCFGEKPQPHQTDCHQKYCFLLRKLGTCMPACARYAHIHIVNPASRGCKQQKLTWTGLGLST